jgi:hypothetical protein
MSDRLEAEWKREVDRLRDKVQEQELWLLRYAKDMEEREAGLREELAQAEARNVTLAAQIEQLLTAL